MNRRLILISVASVLLISLIWYFLLWSPRNDQIDEAELRSETAQEQIDALNLELGRLRAAQRLEPQRRAQLERLRIAVPDTPNVAEFILAVNDIAIASGVDFASIAPGIPAAGNPPVIGLSFSISGGYFQILDFMNRLTALPRLVILDAVNLSPQGSDTIGLSLRARMFVQTAGINPVTTTTAPPAVPAPAPAPGPGAPTVTSTTVAAA